MDFLSARMHQRHQERFGRQPNVQAVHTTISNGNQPSLSQYQNIVPPTIAQIQEVAPVAPTKGPISKIKNNKKKKFTIPNNKDDIIKEIIDEKPTINEVRKALKEYSKKCDEENHED